MEVWSLHWRRLCDVLTTQASHAQISCSPTGYTSFHHQGIHQATRLIIYPACSTRSGHVKWHQNRWEEVMWFRPLPLTLHPWCWGQVRWRCTHQARSGTESLRQRVWVTPAAPCQQRVREGRTPAAVWCTSGSKGTELTGWLHLPSPILRLRL